MRDTISDAMGGAMRDTISGAMMGAPRTEPMA